MNSNKTVLSAILVVLLIIGTYFFLKDKHIIKSGDELGDILSEFNELYIQDSISGKVLYVVSQELRANNPLKTDMILYDHRKIWFRTKKSKSLQPNILNDFIQNDDSIFKKIGSDTIFIKRNQTLNFFLLDYNNE
jgi:hypothetical protein